MQWVYHLLCNMFVNFSSDWNLLNPNWLIFSFLFYAFFIFNRMISIQKKPRVFRNWSETYQRAMVWINLGQKPNDDSELLSVNGNDGMQIQHIHSPIRISRISENSYKNTWRLLRLKIQKYFIKWKKKPNKSFLATWFSMRKNKRIPEND